jgi:hypothetical protein
LAIALPGLDNKLIICNVPGRKEAEEEGKFKDAHSVCLYVFLF